MHPTGCGRIFKSESIHLVARDIAILASRAHDRLCNQIISSPPHEAGNVHSPTDFSLNGGDMTISSIKEPTTSEGSAVIHEMALLLENAIFSAENRWI
jgi:hypothetical protein